MSRRSTSLPLRKPKAPRVPKGRPAARGVALRKLLTKRPSLTAAAVAVLWNTTRQNVWNIAYRQGIRMAVRGRDRAIGL